MLRLSTLPGLGCVVSLTCLLVSCSTASETKPSKADGQGGTSGSSSTSAFLEGDLSGELPKKMSTLGLYPDPADRAGHHERAHSYTPRYPLWTNGSDKQRFIVLPEGTRVDVNEEPWEFPEGTLLFKTFSYGDRPIETRLLRLTKQEWKFAVYLWNEDGTDAELLESLIPTNVEVTVGDESFVHEVPSTLQCKTCHESAPDPVLGFDELRLSASLDGEEVPQLEQLAEHHVLSANIEEPQMIEAEDPLTDQILGYLSGNCVHCHNDGDGPSSAFSLHHTVALDRLVGVESTSELVSGVRVIPGDPDNSGLFLALSRLEDDPRAQPMPPVGVQKRDDEALDMFREWIIQLEETTTSMGGAGGATQ